MVEIKTYNGMDVKDARINTGHMFLGALVEDVKTNSFVCWFPEDVSTKLVGKLLLSIIEGLIETNLMSITDIYATLFLMRNYVDEKATPNEKLASELAEQILRI